MQVKCFLFLATSLSALQMYACHLDGSQEQYTSLRLARAEPANILRHTSLNNTWEETTKYG